MFLNFQESNASRPAPAIRVNGDTGSNYVRRGSANGLTDYSNTSQTRIMFGGQPQGDTTTVPYFTVGYIANLADKGKLAICHNVLSYQLGAGSSDPLERRDTVFKWANTSEAVDQLSIVNHLSGSFNTNGELVVLGYDPDDTHTTNFWEELASVEGDGTSTTISSGTIPARKYLWVQAFTNASSQNTGFQFNNDTGNNYAIRRSSNGGTDATDTSIGYIEGSDTSKAFTNMFIINNSANEKLTIGHSIHNPTAGAGTAPTRNEVAGKWANTSAQITEIDYMQQTTSVNFPSGSILKVWGAN